MLLPATKMLGQEWEMSSQTILLVEDNYADANLILHFFAELGFLQRFIG